jgi:hypothetical protein
MRYTFVCLCYSLAHAGACQEISGDRILAADLAKTNTVFATMDAGRDIGPAPLVGVERTFLPAELARVAKRFGLTTDAPFTPVCVIRAASTLNAERLSPVLLNALGMGNVELSILDFSRYKIAPGTPEFTRSALSPSGFWRGRVNHEGGRSTAIWVRVKVNDAHTGDPIALAPAAAPREIERGDSVTVEVKVGGVRLGFPASAETAGRRGETVLVKNLANGRRLQARVVEKGRVSITR